MSILEWMDAETISATSTVNQVLEWWDYTILMAWSDSATVFRIQNPVHPAVHCSYSIYSTVNTIRYTAHFANTLLRYSTVDATMRLVI